MKYSFKNDYSEGAHPNILKALSEVNDTQQEGYGEDRYSIEAIKLIKGLIKNPGAKVHFIPGGTLANLITISAALKSYESVIAVGTAHINVHEAGAIEATGHKINVVSGVNGKIQPQEIIEVNRSHTDEHMVKPKMVFISNSTEVGTVYSKAELQKVSDTCMSEGLELYLDGARLGSALTSSESDLNLAELSKLVDVFYIGGTKNGALYGEAVVINNPQLKSHFRYHLKQRGALLAKGWAMGVQFVELFKDGLYFDLAKHANKMAGILTKEISGLGYKFLSPSTTNQIFPILPNSVISKLEKSYGFYVWSKIDDETSAIRLVTSWATKEEVVSELLSDLRSF